MLRLWKKPEQEHFEFIHALKQLKYHFKTIQCNTMAILYSYLTQAVAYT